MTDVKPTDQNTPPQPTIEEVTAASEAGKDDNGNHLVINKNDNSKAKWFVVHTYSGHELKVAQALEQRTNSMKLTDYILEILIPTQNKIQIKKGQKFSIKEKLFPGYMLVKLVLTDDSWLAVRTT